MDNVFTLVDMLGTEDVTGRGSRLVTPNSEISRETLKEYGFESDRSG